MNAAALDLIQHMNTCDLLARVLCRIKHVSNTLRPDRVSTLLRLRDASFTWHPFDGLFQLEGCRQLCPLSVMPI